MTDLTESEPRRPSRMVRILIPLAVCSIAYTAFLPALSGGFLNYDDRILFVDNPHYRGFGADQLAWMFSTTLLGNYQPIAWLSWAVDYKISGLNPFSYHRNNLILHALCALCLYLVTLRLFRAASDSQARPAPLGLHLAAAFAALLFAVHPLRAESVVWCAERRDPLSLLFLLLALLAYLRACPPRSRDIVSYGWYIASLFLFVLSLLSKAWGMTFVVVLVILDIYPLRRLPFRMRGWLGGDSRPVWIQKLPFLMLGIAMAVTAAWAQHSSGTMRTLEQWRLSGRIMQAFFGLAYYVRKSVVPAPLPIFHDILPQTNPRGAVFIMSAVAVLVAASIIVALRRRWPGLASAAAIYVVTVAPVLGIAQSGGQLVSNRYSYISCISWAVVVAWLWRAVWRSRAANGWRAGLTSVSIVVVACLFVLTLRHARIWRSDATLWSYAVSASEPSSAAQYGYGLYFDESGRPDQAIERYQKAIELWPDNAYAWFNLGNVHKSRRNFAEAERAFRVALQHKATHMDARINLGNLYIEFHRPQDAIPLCRDAIALIEEGRSEFNPVPYLQLGRALAARGAYAEARPLLQKAAQYPLTRDLAEGTLLVIGGAP